MKAEYIFAEPGQYYIGDICYLFKEQEWAELIGATDCFTLEDNSNYWMGQYKGVEIFTASTAHGDGVYWDQNGSEYFVDSGMLGAVRIDDLPLLGGKLPEMPLGWAVHTFTTGPEVSWEDGRFNFGHLVIDTAQEEEYYGEEDWT